MGEIVRANVLTRFNAMLGVLFVAVLATGRLEDSLFGLVVVANAAIGIAQEVKAKRTLDHLAVLHGARSHAVRDGAVVDVLPHELVLGDLIELRSGDQVPADGALVEADGLEVDESLLTGEADAVAKRVGDDVRSGTIVLSGRGRATLSAVGRDAYAATLAAEARRFTLTFSELRDGVDRLLRWITWVIVVMAPLILWSEWRNREGDDWREPVTGAVAALVGMIPEGLVLLTSLSFLVAALTLARGRVLVQELQAVEVLARVDVVCLDKTGTLTDGQIAFDRWEPVGAGHTDSAAALGALAGLPGANATLRAVAQRFPAPGDWAMRASVPFSSERKWSAASFDGRGHWLIGAPEVLTAPTPDPALAARVQELAAEGRRVLLLATAPSEPTATALPAGVCPVALCVLAERIRPDAADTLRYFGRERVDLRIISGDNPVTVTAIARAAGLAEPRGVDARTLPADDEDLAAAVEAGQVFGRVTPEQKRAMVRALQSRGHVVAMTGDGVNDALALKDADLGVAMGSGSPATRSVAQLVLLDDSFAHLPAVVAEGRRVIANIERVSNLFLTKNAYSLVLAFASAGAGVPYPLLPRHLTLVSALTIGIPGFVLALSPNTERYRPGFLRRVLRFSVPAGVVVAATVFTAYGLARWTGLDGGEARSAATAVALTVGLAVVAGLARPFTPLRAATLAAMVALGALAFVVPPARAFFDLDLPGAAAWWSVTIGVAGAVAVQVLLRVTRRDGAAA